MNASILAVVLAAIALVTPTCVTAQECEGLDDLEWMLGDWRSEVEPTIFNEHWERSSDGGFVGFADARSMETGELHNSEKLRLVKRSGEVLYIAEVAHNDAPVAFRMSRCSGNSVVFENPDHDFPRKIEYRKKGHDEMSAHITDGEGKGFDLFFKRSTDTP